MARTPNHSAALFIVATPIGNLDDMTIRAKRTLQEVDVILAEDTRHTRQLLSHLGIAKKTLLSYHDHLEASSSEALVDQMINEGKSMALVSDAGTPCISDPGYRLVAAARRRGIAVHPVPGASALTSLVSTSGLPTDRFTFIGFLPSKASAAEQEINSWHPGFGSIVFFDTTRRLTGTLKHIAQKFPAARVAVGRELTKLHEEVVCDSIAGIYDWVQSQAVLKGEVVVMVYLGSRDGDQVSVADADNMEVLREEIRRAFGGGAKLKDLLQRFRDCGLSRSDLYRLLLEMKP